MQPLAVCSEGAGLSGRVTTERALVWPLARVRQDVTPQVGRLVGPPRAAGPVARVLLDPVVPVHVPFQRARLARLRDGK